MADVDRRKMLREILWGATIIAVGATALPTVVESAPLDAEALDIDRAIAEATPDGFDALDQWGRRRRRWVCWWHRGRRTCGWRWVRW